MHYGRWWAVQWSIDRTLSIGVHIEPRTRHCNDGTPFGPYLDVHLPGVTLSLGRNPIYAGDEVSRSDTRGGKGC